MITKQLGEALHSSRFRKSCGIILYSYCPYNTSCQWTLAVTSSETHCEHQVFQSNHCNPLKHGCLGQTGPQLHIEMFTCGSLSQMHLLNTQVKSDELRAGMCQRHGRPANCYKPVARQRVQEVRSSQVESSEGYPGLMLAKQRPQAGWTDPT